MITTYVSADTASVLTGKSAQWIRKKVQDGTLPAQTVEGACGQGGISYEIPLEALSPEAQLRYYINIANDASVNNADIIGYQERHGADGLKELLEMQKIVRVIQGMRKTNSAKLRAEMEKLAAEAGTTSRTLYRWEKRYAESGLAGLMRKGRKDAGESRTMCLEARRYVLEEYLSHERRKQEAILAHLREHAKEMGYNACMDCPYRAGSDNRDALVGTADYKYYPECDQPGEGIIIPKHRSAINRLITTVPDEVKCYIRKGVKPWKAAYMMKATRAKPELVNEVWFGDHHVFDLFVVDEAGKLVRPWLTGWYDMATGCLVGWCISTNPNSRTITQALARAVVEKETSPFRGVPVYVYVDNGKDYRCHALEGSTIKEISLGQLNVGLGAKPLYEALRISVIHAKAYHAWAKPIERWFGTLEDRYCRELPGYFGGDNKARPENFERQLKVMHSRGELMTIDEFSQVFIDRILPAYHNKPHSGYGGEKPIERYARLPMARQDIPSWEVVSIAKEESDMRMVSTQGIRFRNRLYWHLDLIHQVAKEVKIRFDRDDLASITVLTRDGHFICEAPLKETMKMVGEDEGKIARHIAIQRKQENDVRERIRSYGVKLPGKRASGNMFYEAVDPRVAKGNYTDLEAERIARAKRAVATAKEMEDAIANCEDYMLKALLERYDKEMGKTYPMGGSGL